MWVQNIFLRVLMTAIDTKGELVYPSENMPPRGSIALTFMEGEVDLEDNNLGDLHDAYTQDPGWLGPMLIIAAFLCVLLFVGRVEIRVCCSGPCFFNGT